MKLEDTGVTYIDLGYEIPQPGVSLVQFEEGVTKQTNEKSGKTTLRLPLVIIDTIEGPEENSGRKLSHFCPIETDYGAKQLAAILSITGLLPTFTKAFGKDADPADEKFLNMLKLKLPGKMIKCQHEVRKDNSGKDRVNIVRFEAVSSNGPKAAPKSKGKAQAPAETTPEDGDF